MAGSYPASARTRRRWTAGSSFMTCSRRSSGRSPRRSTESSVSIRSSSAATSASERSSMNSRRCWASSSSKTSASSSSFEPTARMISSPSLCDAASTRSASWAGCRRASLGWGMRRRTLGTCPVNASTLAQSRNSVETMLAPRRRGATRRRMPRSPVSTPTTRYQPSMRAISISFARTSRAPSMLISWRSRTSFFSSTSPGRRSNRCRSIFSACRSTRPCAISATWSAATNTTRPATEATTPVTGG